MTIDPTTDPEYCASPTSDHKHSESWYDCLPCTLCGDDSKPFACDCGRPSHLAGAPAATTLTVSIDVANDENLVEEAIDVGCVATPVEEGYRPYGTYVYKVVGPDDLLKPLLEGWGYSEGEYTVLTPEVTG